MKQQEKDYQTSLIPKATGSKPHNMLVDTVETYADYFYVEALVRYINPEWKEYW